MQTVTVLITANLRGNLALLPRLHTMIQGQRRQAQGPVLLLDLGDTCALDAWVCRSTGGRAPFFVLDAMGYDGAVIGGPEQVPIPPSGLRQLVSRLSMPFILWNRTTAITKRGLSVTVAPGTPPSLPEETVLAVDRSQEALVTETAGIVTLGDVAAGVLGCVEIRWPGWTAVSANRTALDNTVPADPSIAAIVELVETEARSHAETGGTS